MKEQDNEDFRRYCRTKYDSINKRCKYRDSYIDKGISNKFTFPEFVEYADRKGLEQDFHCHRPDRLGDYEAGNLEFLSPDDHLRVSAHEQRAITKDQASEIRANKDKLSLRKLAKQYGVSHSTIHKVMKRKGIYKDDE
jgi:hypothetical protein